MIAARLTLQLANNLLQDGTDTGRRAKQLHADIDTLFVEYHELYLAGPS